LLTRYVWGARQREEVPEPIEDVPVVASSHTAGP